MRAVHSKVRPGFAGCCELDYLRKREIPPEGSTVSRPAERDPQPENGLYGKFDDLLEGSHTHPEEREEHRPDAGAARSDPPGVGEAFTEAFPRSREEVRGEHCWKLLTRQSARVPPPSTIRILPTEFTVWKPIGEWKG